MYGVIVTEYKIANVITTSQLFLKIESGCIIGKLILTTFYL